MFIRSFTFAFSVLLLAGCQSGGHDSYRSPKPTAAQEKDQALQRDVYEKLISRVLAREGDLANTQGRDGSFNLMLTLDDKNRIIGCGTLPNKKVDARVYPYNRKLAEDLRSICWTAVFPELPSSLIDPETKTARVVAPVLVYPLVALSPDTRARREAALHDKAQNDFLFTQLLAPLPIDSIGVATLMMMTDSTGQVRECAASLDPHSLRPSEFRQDDALLAGLVQRCKQLDMSTMPGFVANTQGMTSAFHRVEYTPWKAGLKPAQSQSCSTTGSRASTQGC